MLPWLLGCVPPSPGTPPTATTTTPTGSTSTGDTGSTSPTPLVPTAVEWESRDDGHLGAAISLGDAWIAVGAPSSGSCCEDHVQALALVLSEPFVGGYAYVDDSTSVSGEDSTEPSAFLNRLGLPLLAAGDLTGDGEGDLVVFDASASSVLGATAFVVPGPVPGRGPLGIEADAFVVSADAKSGGACGDVTGDGQADLCLATGVAFGPIAAGVVADVTWSAVQPEAEILIGGDGLGIVLFDPRTDTLHRLPALSPGDIDPASVATASYAAGGPATALETGWDWTGDGVDDVALAAGGAVHVLSGASLDLVATLPLSATALAGGDFDGDGSDDLAVGTDVTVEVHLGPLPGTLAAIWIGREHPTDAFGSALDAADLDGDGRAELVVGAPQHGVADPTLGLPSGRLYLLWGGGI